jgi:hypothetical protein
MGLTVPSYFYGRWGWNFGGQTTIRRCGANAMQPPPESPGELGGSGACATWRAPTGAYRPKSFSRLRPSISTPLAVALDGGVIVFPTSTVVDFLPEVHHLVAGHRHVVLRWRAHTCIDGWRHLSWCAY